MTQRKFFIVLPLAAAAVCLILASCSELKKEIPPVAPAAKAHPTGWINPQDAVNFHGAALKQASYDLTGCAKCHGASLSGGIANESCSQCHGALYPHPSTWTASTNAAYHGAYLKTKNYNATECQECHGADYRGAGDPDKSCYQCHGSYPHTSAWLNVPSGNSHGQYLKTRSWSATECQNCHGATYSGGTSGQSCFTCHASYPHTSDIETSHPSALRTAGYPLAQCQVCHGANYSGGAIANVSCMTSGCHRDAQGNAKSPESCNTCHGDFAGAASDTSSWAPTSIATGTSNTAAAIGAHAKHLKTNTIGMTVQCQECHAIPATVFSAGHLGSDGRAEVVLAGPVSRTVSGEGQIVPAPTYSSTTYSCSNTFCHGNWRLARATAPYGYYRNFYADSAMVGSNAQPTWNGGAAVGGCGTCHGNAPAGHIASTISACSSCHQGIMDGSGNFTDKSKHVNGKIEVFANPSASMR